MLRSRKFAQVDVFTSRPCYGNPLAVVIDADGLDTAAMQRFAAWTNLAETTFLLPPTDPTRADYRVRIFTTTRELPFAGHPTLGTCHVWRNTGGTSRSKDVIIQECEAGLITIKPDEPRRLAFQAPPLTRSGPLESELIQRLTAGLGISASAIQAHSWLVNGPRWIGLMLSSAEEVLQLKPNAAALRDLDVGVIGPHPPGSECAFEVRGFPFADGAEDPVTGSLNAGLAQWLTSSGLAPKTYIAAQGTVLGRAGRVHVHADDSGSVWIGGETQTVIEGTLHL